MRRRTGACTAFADGRCAAAYQRLGGAIEVHPVAIGHPAEAPLLVEVEYLRRTAMRASASMNPHLA